MNTKNLVLDFYNSETGGPIATISGANAKFLAAHSSYIQNLLEFQNKSNNKGERIVLTVPVSFPTDRVQIFRKLIKKLPLGKQWRNEVYGAEYRLYDPLGPEEEANISRNMQEGRVQSLHAERERVIQQVLSYLMLDPGAEEQFIVFREENEFPNNKRETRRRQRIGRKNAAKYAKTGKPNNKRNYLNEDTIDEILDYHKNYLYSTYKHSPEKLDMWLSRPNWQSRIEHERKKNENHRRRLENLDRSRNSLRAQLRRTRRNSNARAILNELSWIEDEESNLANNGGPFENLPSTTYQYNFLDPNANTMAPDELERYLRSLRREGKEKYLPSQRNTLGLENLYGPANNI